MQKTESVQGTKRTCDSIDNCKEPRIIFGKKNNYVIQQCAQCGYKFWNISDPVEHVDKIYSDEYFFDGKSAGYPNYLDEKKLLLQYGRYYAKIISKYMQPGKVLDTGCAAGFILKGFEYEGWKGTGIEPNETMATYARVQLKLDVHANTLEDFDSNETFDLINMIQVIGHFVDLDKSMENVQRLLRSGGLVLVESWDSGSTLAKIMKMNWTEYSPPSVVRWFSDKTLIDFFSFYGFEFLAKGRPAKRLSVSHALSLLDEKMPNFILKKKIFKTFNKLFGNSTLRYPPLDLKWYIFRKK